MSVDSVSDESLDTVPNDTLAFDESPAGAPVLDEVTGDSTVRVIGDDGPDRELLER